VSSSTGRLIDEVAAAVRPVLAAVRRRAAAIVVGLAVLLTGLGALALSGAASHDAAIEANLALADAEVLEGSGFSRTLVRFTTVGGETVVPERGVFYPRGLEPGDVIAVEYDATEPEIVRVAGRSVAVGVGPVALGVLGIWTVLGPLALWLRHRVREETG
jgi:hypothetical protein